MSSKSDALSFPKPNQDDIGWLLTGGGALGLFVNLLRGRRRRVDWAISLGLFGLGCSLLLKGRQARMETAEESIRAELSALDPIARAQILKAVAEEQIGRMSG
jgi:hypothetical protein